MKKAAKKRSKADLKKHFDRIANLFDDVHGEGGEQCRIADHCIYESGYYKLRPGDIEDGDPWFDMVNDLFSRAFSLGFVLGQTTEICWPDVRKSVRAVHEAIREEALLPYISRRGREATYNP